MNLMPTYESLTYSEAQTLVNNNGLTPNTFYYITDRNVILAAINGVQSNYKSPYAHSYSSFGGFGKTTIKNYRGKLDQRLSFDLC